MTTNAPLSKTLHEAATVELYDDSDGIFGELIHPVVVVSSLKQAANHSDLVGKLDEPSTVPVVELKSLSFAPSDNGDDMYGIGMEFDNTTNETLRVRWINEQGNSVPSHVWTIEPTSNLVQYTKAGHLFIISVITKKESDLFDASHEEVLGAYRPLRSLPSGSSHCIMIQEQLSHRDSASRGTTCFVVETMLLDETKQDALIVAASALDPLVSGMLPPIHPKTLATLTTIVSNVLAHPQEEKYRKLRLGNHKLQRYICESWGAMRLLDALGFRSVFLPCNENKKSDSKEESMSTDTAGDQANEEEFLLLREPPSSGIALGTFHRAKELLNLLITRSNAHFAAELAPPTPWQRPRLASSTNTHGSASRWNTQGTHFITDEERWHRAERIAGLRRSGRGRPPPPGEAPSSRGRWGR